MITLLLPVGKFSIFAELCIENIMATCGNNENLDFAFIVSKNPSPKLEEKFEQLSSKYKFRVIRSSFETSTHLHLIDWALYEGLVNKWVILQHCDVFWFTNNWFNIIEQKVADNPDAVCLRHNWKWSFFTDGTNMVPLLHDFFGVYRSDVITKHGYRFTWGKWGSGVELSSPTTKALEKGEILWNKLTRSHSNSRIIKPADFLDGSEALTLEFFVNHRDRVVDLPFTEYISDGSPADLIHFWDIFRIGRRLRVDDGVLKYVFGEWKHRHFYWSNSIKIKMLFYSYITSHLIDKEESIGEIIPWDLFTEWVEDHGWKGELDLWVKEIIQPLFGHRTISKNISENIKELQIDDFSFL